ncbi:SDR family oxidoreductase [Jannaschia donghaensis]|uniref:Putative oxidoreductase SadH n=1 Tax=Jannaschia donghaensis TaxID=420998 RepID=A0A0M6YGU4_9RHOB|nr:SDR family oxidoreductase [Jannaschia donghaensis]CTQ48905.1 Putative oxidoreductase SadH [Jannaschia donghaensis]
MSRKLHSPVAVIAGGSAGVGRATLDAILDRGWRVAVLARGQDRLTEISDAFGDRVWTRSVDVSDGAAMDRAADAIVEEFGRPEIWVNSAMLTSFSPFDDVDEAEFRRITDTTYLGTVNGCRAALAVMRRGNIVNVGSGLAYTSVPNQAAYCGAKHAIEGFTQALRIEIARAKRPVTLSMVQLPAINTPQFDWARNRMETHPQPAPPIFQPEVAARAVLQAIDTDAREILVGRSVLKLMAGNMLFPEVVERQLTQMGVEAQKAEGMDPDARDNLQSPADYPSRAHGSFDARAEDDGIIVDGDFARKAALFGGAAALLTVGILLGRTSRASMPRLGSDGDDDTAVPYYVRPTEYRS